MSDDEIIEVINELQILQNRLTLFLQTKKLEDAIRPTCIRVSRLLDTVADYFYR